MSGLRDVIQLVPPVMAGLSILSPSQTLSTARIIGSNNATYGTVGWLPPTNGSAFALMWLGATKEKELEFGRVRAVGSFYTFIAIDHSDNPAQYEDFHDCQVAWVDAMRQLVASNRSLMPGSLTLYPVSGDVRWQMTDSKMIDARPYFGHSWRGVEITTNLEASIIVNYQG